MPPPKAPPRPPPKSQPPRPTPMPLVTPPPAKSFRITPWTGAGEGEKLILYGASGRGKTTLASMAPAPVFIGLDDGGRKVRNPITGEAVAHVEGVETFDDVRQVLQDRTLFQNAKSIVIDTGTVLELLAIQWVIANIKHEKAGVKIEHLDDYGYGKGYVHLFDTMRLVFQDLDGLVRGGRNVIILCQQCPVVVANPSGANFLENGPKLYAPGPDSKQSFTVRGYACEWADHVLKLDYLQRIITGDRVDERTGKQFAGKATGDATRAVFTMPSDPSYFAKTRTLTDPVVSFAEAKDDSLWRLLFPEVQ